MSGRLHRGLIQCFPKLQAPKRLLKALVFSLAFATQGLVMAGPFEDAYAALGRNDYLTALRGFMSLGLAGNADAQYNLG